MSGDDLTIPTLPVAVLSDPSHPAWDVLVRLSRALCVGHKGGGPCAACIQDAVALIAPLLAAEQQAREEGAREAYKDAAAAGELWRVFLRLPNMPSPLGDYVQRRVLVLRERAAQKSDQR